MKFRDPFRLGWEWFVFSRLCAAVIIVTVAFEYLHTCYASCA